MQQTLPERLAILGAKPDFLLLFTSLVALTTTRPKAALTGAAAGVVHGALAGVSLAAYVSSRAVAGFCAAWSKTLRYEVSLGTVAAITFAATMFADIVWLLIAPQAGIGAFLGATIGTAVYNGFLAIPVYALLRRFTDPPRR
jgi:rod shape-determining protein MreD